MIEKARDLIANGNPEAVGYRLLVKPIDASVEMEATQKEQFPTLASSNFQDKTDDQASKLSRGSSHGILAHIGEYAYKASQLGGKNWVEEGDTVIFDRYAGVEVELPPGSGKSYRFMNDESLLGKMVEK